MSAPGPGFPEESRQSRSFGDERDVRRHARLEPALRIRDRKLDRVDGRAAPFRGLYIARREFRLVGDMDHLCSECLPREGIHVYARLLRQVDLAVAVLWHVHGD